MSAAASNPCSPSSGVVGGLLDYSVVVHINLLTLTLRCEGKVDEVPAYEMYVQADNRLPVAIFRISPASGKTFDALIGSANRTVKAQVMFLGTPHCLDGRLFVGPQPEFCPEYR